MRVAIRTDASPQIGSGHVMRMLALASAMRVRGASVTFITRQRAGDMREVITRAGFPVVPLAADDSMSDAWLGASYDAEMRHAHSALQMLAPLELLVVDHYSIDARWETQMRAYAGRIAVVDDLFDRPHDCDVLLNQNLGAEDPGRYECLVPKQARLLLGPQFAILREEFRRYAAHVRQRDGNIGRILIFISGFDPDDETGKAVGAVASIAQPLPHVDVVLPPQAPHAQSVRALCERSGFTYLGRVDSIAPLMDAADLSIGAMGSATWERCVTGLPAIVVTLAQNQRPSAQACARTGAVEWLGDASSVDPTAIASAVEALRHDASRVREMSQRARCIVGAGDGTFSTDRVVQTFMGVVNV